MTNKELELLTEIKRQLIDQGSMVVKEDNIYELLIEGRHWHGIFKTEEAKKKGVVQ